MVLWQGLVYNVIDGKTSLCIYILYVLSGLPGQFQCGNKRCENKEGLKSWEVNFAYVEHGEKRNALVKLSKCSVFSSL